MNDPNRPCTSVRLGRKAEDDKACGLPIEHPGAHEYTVKRSPHGGWEDGGK